MNNRDRIQITLDYIDDNLKSDITAKELSHLAGYSLFHYYRLFQMAVGTPLMQYVLHRRLLHAVFEISCGNKMTDVALSYGFSNHSGFYKAFIREFGYTPAMYLKTFKVKKPYRINLKEEEHIIITHKRIKEILKNWDLENEKIADIVHPETGTISENAYYIGDDYVLKITPNLGKLKKHTEVSSALADVGISAATQKKTLNGEEYIYEGELFFYLTRRITGNPMMSGDLYEGDYLKKARFVGEIVGQLSEDLNNLDAVVNEANLFVTVSEWAMEKAGSMVDIPESLREQYFQNFGSLYSRLPKQIIHRNPHPGNIIVNDDTWGFVDFDLTERNVRIFDPCYAATAILSESFLISSETSHDRWIEIYKAIISGYDDVVKLTAEEKAAIPFIILSIQFICLAWFKGRDKLAEVLNINIEMTKWIMERFDQLKLEEA